MVEALARALEQRTPAALVVLGSGLTQATPRLHRVRHIPFADIAGLPPASVAGHAGEFVIGTLGPSTVIVQSGRFHLYEGHDAATVVAPVRAARELGAEVVVLTNACGAIRRTLKPGSLGLITDHINFTFRNPLIGPVRAGDTRFTDMSRPYDPVLSARAREVARTGGIVLEDVAYAGVSGPSYETAAEIRMLDRLGADVVGMSTVLEVVAARAAGLRCLGFSVVSNWAAGLSAGRLTHEEVVSAAARASGQVGELLAGLLG